MQMIPSKFFGLLTAMLTLTACGSFPITSFKMYSGPSRPPEQIARLYTVSFCNVHVTAIDGKTHFNDGRDMRTGTLTTDNNLYELPPGQHTIQLRFAGRVNSEHLWGNYAQYYGSSSQEKSVTFLAAPGTVYYPNGGVIGPVRSGATLVGDWVPEIYHVTNNKLIRDTQSPAPLVKRPDVVRGLFGYPQ